MVTQVTLHLKRKLLIRKIHRQASTWWQHTVTNATNQRQTSALGRWVEESMGEGHLRWTWWRCRILTSGCGSEGRSKWRSRKCKKVLVTQLTGLASDFRNKLFLTASNANTGSYEELEFVTYLLCNRQSFTNISSLNLHKNSARWNYV